MPISSAKILFGLNRIPKGLKRTRKGSSFYVTFVTNEKARETLLEVRTKNKKFSSQCCNFQKKVLSLQRLSMMDDKH